MPLTTLSPAAQHTLSVPGGPTVRVACFGGLDYQPDDWSLRPLQQQADVETNQVLADRIDQACCAVDAKNVLAPSPVLFNGEMVEPGKLDQEIILPSGTTLFRNQHMPADGSVLNQAGDAGAFSAGGCPLIVAIGGDQVAFAHAGRDCVLDPARIRAGQKHNAPDARPHESVVDSLMQTMFARCVSPGAIRVWVLWSIPTMQFGDDLYHCEFGEINQRRLDYLNEHYPYCSYIEHTRMYINIPAIIREQFKQLGVPEKNINLQHAELPSGLPHTRMKEVDTKARYLVLAVRQ